MVPVRDLFEGHLTVSDLSRSMTFFSEVLGLQLAHVAPERRVAFYWIGGPGKAMLGLWEVGAVPQRLNLHLAFRTDLDDLLQAPARLRRAGVTPLDFSGSPTDEPVVLAWMPAASLYFNDPDGNLLEYLSMLPEAPEPALGVVEWARWTQRTRRRLIGRAVETGGGSGRLRGSITAWVKLPRHSARPIGVALDCVPASATRRKRCAPTDPSRDSVRGPHR